MWPGSAAGQREGCGLAGSALGTAGCPPQATQVSEKKNQLILVRSCCEIMPRVRQSRVTKPSEGERK